MATVVRADVYVKSSVSATQSTDDGGPQDQPTSPPSAPTPRPPPARRRDSARTSPLPLGTTKRPSFGQALDATPLQNAPTPSPADAPRIELATPSDASSHRPSPYTHPWITATPDTPASSHRTPYRTSSLRLNRSQTSFADVSAHITDISKWGRASGGYCDVHTGVLSGVGPVALKKLRMHAQTDSAQAEKVRSRFRHEAEMWCRLDHKHVLPFLGICVDGPNLYMCSSWQDNGDLPHYLKDHPDADRFALMTQTAEALLYLHENGVIHGDLKGNNVLISSNGEALLCDFGLAIVLSEIAVMSGLPSDLGGKGTWRYMAPELFAVADDVDVAKTSSSDVFAYGMLLAETITGQIPMHHLHNEPAVLWAISNGTRPTRPHIWRDTHEEVLWSLAEHCWDARPSERPESADIVAFLQWYTPVRNGIPVRSDRFIPSSYVE
ncbi:kinase-like domain-containing protein [Schizophyllum fasciatum]